MTDNNQIPPTTRDEAIDIQAASYEARIAELEAQLEQVDEVLIVNWVGPRKDGDYRKALHDLVTQAIQEHDDPAVSKVAADRKREVEDLRAKVAELEVDRNNAIREAAKFKFDALRSEHSAERWDDLHERIPKGFAFTPAYQKGNEIVVIGSPGEEDESHSCDQMGCGTFDHVIARVYLNAPEVADLRAQLAESQAREWRLREALEKISRMACWQTVMEMPLKADCKCFSCGARAALAAVHGPGDPIQLRIDAETKPLHMEIERLREALEPFATYARTPTGGNWLPDSCPMFGPESHPGTRPTVGDLRRAAEALDDQPQRMKRGGLYE